MTRSKIDKAIEDALSKTIRSALPIFIKATAFILVVGFITVEVNYALKGDWTTIKSDLTDVVKIIGLLLIGKSGLEGLWKA